MNTILRFRSAVVLTLVAMSLVASTTPTVADDETATHYYLALGDSLAQGYQPNASYPPYYQPDGYVPQIYATLQSDDPKLTLNNVSCGGEGTLSMIDGSHPYSVAPSCGTPEFYRWSYPHKTQLAEAVHFLDAHKGKVDLVTIDIGGNDLGFCLFRASDVAGCLATTYASVSVNLNEILTQLESTGTDATIVGMTYYNPAACLYLFDPQDPTPAFASAQIQTLNQILVSIYTAHGVRIADVAGAFGVGAGLQNEGTAALSWTWFCSADHPGDIHTNTAGYQVIAQAFLDALD